MEHKTHTCLVSQLKTLTQNAEAFEYQGEVEEAVSVHLVKLAALWLA